MHKRTAKKITLKPACQGRKHFQNWPFWMTEARFFYIEVDKFHHSYNSDRIKLLLLENRVDDGDEKYKVYGIPKE